MGSTAVLAAYVQTKIGTPYVYAAKMETITEAKIQMWKGLYPSTFTSTYVTKARKFIGKIGTDCSGLISAYTGRIRGSSDMKNSATYCVGISALNESHIGYILWRSGHVGVYIGNGYCVEARGIDYGTVKTKVANRTFTHVILLPELTADGTATTGSTTTGTTTTNTTATGAKTSVSYVQTWLNSNYGLNLAVDNAFGPKTKARLVTALQIELNKQYNKGLEVDGVFGPLTKAACVNVKKGTSGNITGILQGALICRGYSVGSDGLDCDFGSNTDSAVRKYQTAKGLEVDGIAGKETFAGLLI